MEVWGGWWGVERLVEKWRGWWTSKESGGGVVRLVGEWKG